MTECPKCGEKAVKYGKRKGIQRFQCRKGHIFTLENPSGEHGSPSPEPQPQQQPEPQYYEQPQDLAEQVYAEAEKPKEPEQPKPQRNPSEFNSPSIVGEFIGEQIADLLNQTLFKQKEKKQEQEGLDYI